MTGRILLVKIMSETTLPPQPRRFALAGDQLRIFCPPESYPVPGIDPAVAARVQFHVPDHPAYSEDDATPTRPQNNWYRKFLK